MPSMSSCRLASLMDGHLIRYGLLGLLVSALAAATCGAVLGGDASQKLATALEEMSVVLALLTVHLVVSKLRGGEPQKAQKKAKKKKDADAPEDRDGAVPAALEGAAADQEACQQAIGKLTTQIRAAVKMGDMLAAEGLMQEMREVGGTPGYLRRPCWSVAFGEIVSGYVRGGDAPKASEWLDAFAACAPLIRPSTACANSVIGALCASGDIASAEAWVSKMPQSGVRLDEDTFSSLIHGCVRAGDVPRGIHWLREMRRANLRPGAELNKFVLQACSEGRKGTAE
ncbi:unnamed protein product [Prorocentrum cordatum]|uniref:Pentatricopeptide repeat-containing protein n=1 Tax=Prorocentrum cordatum TaxID=2364126 RepID=A0ABN9WM89_9DINO|nr:unnamed protein product [Polarella glacialis]|mmetsp:Transcript_98111/g.255745  ORF Transcript_98111/g.255745 Transcript_98111/m.255745 type:complete len:285 (-) Transcript_98111:51-905(-)